MISFLEIYFNGKKSTHLVKEVSVTGGLYNHEYRLSIPKVTMMTFVEIPNFTKVQILHKQQIVFRGYLSNVYTNDNQLWRLEFKADLENMKFKITNNLIPIITNIYSHTDSVRKYILPLELIAGLIDYFCAAQLTIHTSVNSLELGWNKKMFNGFGEAKKVFFKETIIDYNFLLNIHAEKLNNKTSSDWYVIPNYTFFQALQDLLFTAGLFLEYSEDGYILKAINVILKNNTIPENTSILISKGRKKKFFYGFSLNFYIKSRSCKKMYQETVEEAVSVQGEISNTFDTRAASIMTFPIGKYSFEWFNTYAHTELYQLLYSSVWDIWNYSAVQKFGNWVSYSPPNNYKNTIIVYDIPFFVRYEGELDMLNGPQYGKKKYMIFSQPVSEKTFSFAQNTYYPNPHWNIHFEVVGFTRVKLENTGDGKRYQIIQEIEKNGEWQDVQKIKEKWCNLKIKVLTHRTPLLSIQGFVLNNGVYNVDSSFVFPEENPIQLGEGESI